MTDLSIKDLLPKGNGQDYEAYRRDIPVGHQIVIRFPNGYGASIVKLDEFFGLLFSDPSGIKQSQIEVAVIEFTGPGTYDWDLCYDTPLTDDVLRHVTKLRCIEILNDIKNLPPKRKS